MGLTFRWLGTAGIELKAGEQVLAIDPFFTRPSLAGLIKPITSNAALAAEKLPHCQAVLVTHSHWDHVMDVPAVVSHSGAVAYGSANTCQLLRMHGIPEVQIRQVAAGDTLHIGSFEVEVIPGQHSWIPFSNLFNGLLATNLQPPLRLQDYRMDVCLGYCLRVMGYRVLVCAAQAQPADVLFSVAQESRQYFTRLLRGVQPRVFVPIHWDNFLRPIDRPLRKLTRPGRMALRQVTQLARQVVGDVKVIIPEMFREYDLRVTGNQGIP